MGYIIFSCDCDLQNMPSKSFPTWHSHCHHILFIITWHWYKGSSNVSHSSWESLMEICYEYVFDLSLRFKKQVIDYNYRYASCCGSYQALSLVVCQHTIELHVILILTVSLIKLLLMQNKYRICDSDMFCPLQAIFRHAPILIFSSYLCECNFELLMLFPNIRMCHICLWIYL